MRVIYTHIPETNYVPSQYGVADVLLFLFMVLISLVSVLNLLYFYIIGIIIIIIIIIINHGCVTIHEASRTPIINIIAQWIRHPV
jgi:hypothetical protein